MRFRVSFWNGKSEDQPACYRLEYRGFFTHQRLLNRQADGAGDSEGAAAELCPSNIITAAIAAASSSVGVGDTFMSNIHEPAAATGAERIVRLRRDGAAQMIRRSG